MAAPGLLSHSGGLIWHAKAWRRHATLWADFCLRIERFLIDWIHALPQQRNEEGRLSGIILLGPSGGWCLPKAGFLKHFQSVVMVDSDPSAKTIFYRRHQVRLHPEQDWIWIPSSFEQALPALLARYPRHAVLFCNVLGQLRYQDSLPLERIEFELNQIKFLLSGRHWASFHDRISGEARHAQSAEFEFSSPSVVQTAMLAKRVASQGEWLDHLTENVLPPQADRRLLHWPISLTRLHWVEAGWVS
ncbi:MAG: hypothetical protein FGM18_05010 [Burkholderiaceae bacterium]|nr:hypothetical protein [Burkholderiaceae bacterium]